MTNYINLVQHNIFILTVAIVILMDTFFGVCRALKEHKFNSCFGIDGGIRKIAMLGCIAFLAGLDMCIKINVAFMLPKKWISYLGTDQIGLCEFFSILFILYEAISILKNMLLCGLPIPVKLRKFLEKMLNYFTDELPDTEITEEVQ
ncbi:phage holin family protein [Clostridium butyricum]|uniref:phage holin family protein n=1 Tax=Clostridium butyricum TaxID=1492 RepID=UPI0034672369